MSEATGVIRALLQRQRSGALRVLSQRYPLPRDVLGKSVWNVHTLHTNPRLPWRELLQSGEPPFEIRFATLSKLGGPLWDAQVIERHEGSWDWTALSANPHLPWSKALIERFADRWDWTALSGNRGVPFDPALLSAFDDRWEVSRLAANTAVPWDGKLVRRYASLLGEDDPQWHGMLEHDRPQAVAPGVMFRRTGWLHLMQNPEVAWAEVLPALPEPDWRFLSRNPGLPWSESFLKRHAAELDPGGLCANRAIPWTAKRIAGLIDGAEERLQLSSNPALPWSESLVDRFADRWRWQVLSGNPGVPWTVALLERHADRIKWDRLSSNGALTPEILDRFADRLNWSWGVSCNRVMTWSVELMDRYLERFDWERLSWHPKLPWSDELLVRFMDRWMVRSFERTEEAWAALAPHVDDAWVRRLVG